MKPETPITFQASSPFSLGVEIELQILDKQSLNLIPKAPEILAMVPMGLQERIKPEFIRSMIEINTEVCADMNQVRKNLRWVSCPIAVDAEIAQRKRFRSERSSSEKQADIRS